MVAVGAVLVAAVDASVAGVGLAAVGWILMILGGVGAMLSAMSSSIGHRDDERVVRPRQGAGL